MRVSGEWEPGGLDRGPLRLLSQEGDRVAAAVKFPGYPQRGHQIAGPVPGDERHP